MKWWGGKERLERLESEVAWKVSVEEVKARNYNLDFKNPHTVIDEYKEPEDVLGELIECQKETDRLRDKLRFILEEALNR